MTRRRWSDNEHKLGPFTYSRDEYGKTLSIVLDSGEEEYAGCCFRLRGFGHTFIVNLPPLLQPYREKRVAQGWDAATVARMGGDWYYAKHRREYGFTLNEGFLNIYLGRQTDDSSTEQRWGWFLPWTQWRHVRHTLYDTDGANGIDVPQGSGSFDALRAIQQSIPKATFSLIDFDGEPVRATTFVEEREWRFGTGWWSWLSAFRRPKINRSLSIEFRKQTGPEKGSWKGGTTGTGIEMLPGETPENAMRRYCEQEHLSKYRRYRMSFAEAA